MWCHWCRKANHEDARCFSTRPADWRPKPDDAEPVLRSRELERTLRELLQPPQHQLWTWLRPTPPP